MLRLKELRKQNKLTQQQLAEMLGVTQAALSGWENEKFGIDNGSLLKCAKSFQGLPNIPSRKLKSLNAIRIPYIGAYLNTSNSTIPGSISRYRYLFLQIYLHVLLTLFSGRGLVINFIAPSSLTIQIVIKTKCLVHGWQFHLKPLPLKCI